MLNKLFGSTARVKILKFFISNPDSQFYIRQIARDLELQLNSVRRELDNLENFGLLHSTTETKHIEVKSPEDGEKKTKQKAASKTDKKFYSVNKNFVLFEELKALFIKAQVMYENDFKDKMLAVGKPQLMILSGFFVNIDSASTDILIVGTLDREKTENMISDLEKEMNREINYTIMDMDEYLHRRDITDVFLYEILENKKIVVIDELKIS